MNDNKEETDGYDLTFNTKQLYGIDKSEHNLIPCQLQKTLYLSFMLSLVAFVPRLLSDVIGQDIFLNISPFHPQRLWLVLINLSSTIFFIAILWRMHCVMRNQHEGFIEDLMIGINKFMLVTLAVIFESLLLFGFAMLVFGTQILLHQYDLLVPKYGILLFLISGLMMFEVFLLSYIATLFIFLTPIIAIENKSIVYALERSVLLVWNHWWRVFSLQITPWLCYFLALLLIRFVFHINIHIYFLEHGSHTLSTTLLHMALFTLFIPWVAALLLLQLKDLEQRKQLTS